MLLETRARRPAAIAEAAAARRRPPAPVDDDGRAMIIAADHTARGILGAGQRAEAMADRGELLDRIQLALSRPGVTGVMASPDILEDAATPATLEACARAVSDLAARGLVAMVEPFMAGSVEGRVRPILLPDAAIRASVVAAALGTTSAYTWLKVPVVHDMERVIAATTLPTLLLGGEVARDQAATFERWGAALRVPGAIGLVVGRSLLFPPDDDVAAAVDTAVGLIPRPDRASVAASGS